MLKKIVLGCLCALSLAAYEVERGDQITYDWLVEYAGRNGCCDHIHHFKALFDGHKVRTMLEFGMGYSTAYFLNRCTKVISIEFVTPGFGPAWMKYSLGLYRDFSNWVPIAYFTGLQGDTAWAPYKYCGSDAVYRAAAYQGANQKSYAPVDDFYQSELNSFLKNLIRSNKPELAFVDPGIVLRSDLVTLLFGKVPIIVAHDTNARNEGKPFDVYGYPSIATPAEYVEIFLPGGQGTTVWVVQKPEYESLIQSLWDYQKSL